MLCESLQVIDGIDISPGSQEVYRSVVSRQYLKGLLKYRAGAPWYAAECIGKQAVVAETDKVITAVKGWADDAVDVGEMTKGIGDDFNREIGDIATHEDGTVKTPGEGVTEAVLHSAAEVFSSLGEVLEVFPEEGFKTCEGMLRMKTYEQGGRFRLES